MKYTQADIDAILKKLSEQGYDGLSRDEKRMLFQKQLQESNSNRYDTPLELLLILIIMLEIVIHGVQRIVLASQLPVYLKLNSVIQNPSVNTWFNIGLGLFLVIFFGLSFILSIKDYFTGNVHFIYHAVSRKGKWKYIGKIIVMLLVIAWLTIRVIDCWKV